jgi:hypothetical protein
LGPVENLHPIAHTRNMCLLTPQVLLLHRVRDRVRRHVLVSDRVRRHVLVRDHPHGEACLRQEFACLACVVSACPGACLRQIPTCATWPLNQRGHWWDFCPYRVPLAGHVFKVQVAGGHRNPASVKEREVRADSLSRDSKFLFHTVKYCVEIINEITVLQQCLW